MKVQPSGNNLRQKRFQLRAVCDSFRPDNIWRVCRTSLNFTFYQI